MSTTGKTKLRGLRYHVNAYQFVLAALRYTQEKLERTNGVGENEELAHISGQELLDGTRQFACEHFGLMTLTVFRTWGLQTTDDIGNIVFELVERGEMRKTERDLLSDFSDYYDFEEVFDRQYRIDVSRAFAN